MKKLTCLLVLLLVPVVGFSDGGVDGSKRQEDSDATVKIQACTDKCCDGIKNSKGETGVFDQKRENETVNQTV